MDAYITREAYRFIEALSLISSLSSKNGLLIGNKVGNRYFIQKVFPSLPKFYSSLKSFFEIDRLFEGKILGFFSFNPTPEKKKRILAPFAHSKLFLEIHSSPKGKLRMKAYVIEYERDFILSPINLLNSIKEHEEMKSLNEEQKKILLNLARQAIEHYLKTEEPLKIEVKDEQLRQMRGAFVTLKFEGELRGCIGYPLPYKPLYETVIEVAISAATQDFRFKPLSLDELEKTKIEISVLTLPKTVKNIKEIKIGEHGIIVSKGPNRGLLLPQVPLEWGWDLETFLRHGCLKAGLDEDEWKKGAKIEIFSAEVFSE